MTSTVEILIFVCMRMGIAIQVGTARSRGNSATNVRNVCCFAGLQSCAQRIERLSKQMSSNVEIVIFVCMRMGIAIQVGTARLVQRSNNTQTRTRWRLICSLALLSTITFSAVPLRSRALKRSTQRKGEAVSADRLQEHRWIRIHSCGIYRALSTK